MRIRVAPLALTLISTLSVFAQTPPSSQFTLTIALQNRYNPDLRVCMRISKTSPIKLAWTENGVENKMTASMLDAVDGKYPISFTLKQTAAKSTFYDLLTVPKLKLDKPQVEFDVVSSLFGNIYRQALLLSTNPCNGITEFQWKPQ